MTVVSIKPGFENSQAFLQHIAEKIKPDTPVIVYTFDHEDPLKHMSGGHCHATRYMFAMAGADSLAESVAAEE
jgi:hypothetical protein